MYSLVSRTIKKCIESKSGRRVLLSDDVKTTAFPIPPFSSSRNDKLKDSEEKNNQANDKVEKCRKFSLSDGGKKKLGSVCLEAQMLLVFQHVSVKLKNKNILKSCPFNSLTKKLHTCRFSPRKS